MSEDEIYVTCVCGALVNEASMSQHFEDCLQEDFVRNSTSLKISKPRSYGEQPPKARHVCGKCIRCGHAMYKDKGTLITFYPSIPHSDVTCCYYRDKSGKNREMNESTCKMCKLPNDFHQDRPENEKEIVNCIDDILKDVCENEKAEKCRRQKSMFSKFLERLLYGSTGSSSKDTFDSDGREDTPGSYNSEATPDHHHTVLNDEIHSGPTCRLFHLTLIPIYNKNSEDSSYRSYSLLLQILDTLPPGIPAAAQTDLPTTIDFGIQVKILGVYPEEVQKLLGTGKEGYDIPAFDPKVEAAFRSHLSTLIPCRHCSRTFSPDRIQTHMSCCIERPRTRESVTPTPTKGEISERKS